MQGEKLIGTAEIGFALRPLLQSVKASSGAEVAIFTSAAMTLGQCGGSGGSDLQLKDSTDSRIFEAIATSPAFRLARDSLQFETTINGERWGVVVEPLLDFSGRMIGGTPRAQTNLRSRSSATAGSCFCVGSMRNSESSSRWERFRSIGKAFR